MTTHVRSLSGRSRPSDEELPKSEPKQKAGEKQRPDAEKDHESPSLVGKLRQRPLLVGAIAAASALVLLGALIWWLHARQYESTDDAFIDARTVSISSQVNGAITEVLVDDNQVVDAGQALVRIDQRDYQAALDLARAQVEQAEANIRNLDAQIEAQQSRIDQAEKQEVEAQSALTFSQQENSRYQDLLRTGAGTRQRAEQASSDLRQRQAAYDAAEANLLTERKQTDVLRTQRDSTRGQLHQAEANLEQAKANFDRTTIVAPVAGRVTKLTAAKGAYAVAGQSLMMFVPKSIWVTANFKETQLTYMRPGQPVDIEIDAYPDRTLRGRVDSIQAGSGAAFAVLPPENATGNYVKVVQRVPVKITFDEPPDIVLGPGMSIVPTVKVR